MAHDGAHQLQRDDAGGDKIVADTLLDEDLPAACHLAHVDDENIGVAAAADFDDALQIFFTFEGRFVSGN